MRIRRRRTAAGGMRSWSVHRLPSHQRSWRGPIPEYPGSGCQPGGVVWVTRSTVGAPGENRMKPTGWPWSLLAGVVSDGRARGTVHRRAASGVREGATHCPVRHVAQCGELNPYCDRSFDVFAQSCCGRRRGVSILGRSHEAFRRRCSEWLATLRRMTARWTRRPGRCRDGPPRGIPPAPERASPERPGGISPRPLRRWCRRPRTALQRRSIRHRAGRGRRPLTPSARLRPRN